MKICRAGANVFFRTDGQTDTMKLTVTFRNFANMPKNVKLYILMGSTQKLATIQIHHLTGNALN